MLLTGSADKLSPSQVSLAQVSSVQTNDARIEHPPFEQAALARGALSIDLSRLAQKLQDGSLAFAIKLTQHRKRPGSRRHTNRGVLVRVLPQSLVDQ